MRRERLTVLNQSFPLMMKECIILGKLVPTVLGRMSPEPLILKAGFPIHAYFWLIYIQSYKNLKIVKIVEEEKALFVGHGHHSKLQDLQHVPQVGFHKMILYHIILLL